MLDYNADGLSDQDIERLAALMAKDPKFAHELADAIATRLDEKYGFRQGEIIDDIEKVSGKIDGLSSKLDAMGHRFSTLEHNFGVFGQKLDLIGP